MTYIRPDRFSEHRRLLQNEYAAKYRKNNPAKVRAAWRRQNENQKAWRAKNPVKYWAQKTVQHHRYSGYKVTLQPSDLVGLAHRQKYRCFYCNTRLDFSAPTLTNKKATLDRMQNGKVVSLRGVCILCHSCNSTKRDRTHKSFLKFCGFMVRKFSMEASQ